MLIMNNKIEGMHSLSLFSRYYQTNKTGSFPFKRNSLEKMKNNQPQVFLTFSFISVS